MSRVQCHVMLPAPMNGHRETIYCGKPHRLRDGAPVGHSCRLLDPAYLAAERDEDYGRAASILVLMPLVLHDGVEHDTTGAPRKDREEPVDGDLGDPRGRLELRSRQERLASLARRLRGEVLSP